MTVGPNVTSAVSHALFYGCAKAMDGQFPYLQMYSANMLKTFQLPLMEGKLSPSSPGGSTPVQEPQGPGKSLPKLIINVFNGGKELGAKVKFSRFYLIIDVNPYDIARQQMAAEEGEGGDAPEASQFDIHETYIKF